MNIYFYSGQQFPIHNRSDWGSDFLTFKFREWLTGQNYTPKEKDDSSVFDISPEFDQVLFTGKDGFEKNCEYINKLIGKSKDILLRKFTLASGKRAAVLFVDGMSNKALLESSVILASRRFADYSYENKFSPLDEITQLFGSGEISVQKSLSKAYLSALSGDAAVIIDGAAECYIVGVRAIESRSVGESPNEGSIRGPHEGFTENIRTNTALLRRRLADPNLVIEPMKVGLRSHTDVCICYIRGVTNTSLVEEVRRRISNISTDILGDSGKLEQLIERNNLSIFPQAGGTEQTDLAAAAISNGQVLILVNGSPHALIVPITVSELISVSEDNYENWFFAGCIRILRWICALISVSAPALYVAIISYHPEMLPTKLLLLTALNRVNVPFPAIVEVLLIELVFEIIREASTRMPQKISAALSIVGGLIIGDATINAGLLSPLIIIIAGISTLSSFAVPSYSLKSTIRFFKYFLIVCASVLGIFGTTAGMLIMLSSFVSQRNFGVPFSSPMSPVNPRQFILSMFQAPARMHRMRNEVYDSADRFSSDRSESDNE